MKNTLRSFLGALLLCVGVLPASAQTPFTLEQVMSAPFPSDLVAAPGQPKVAWVQNDEGARNLWVAEAPDWQGQQVTAYTGDDGQELGSLTWTPDGEHLVYVHGGSPNRQGEHPNPTSDPEAARTVLYVVRAEAGAEPRMLTGGASPTVAPDGSHVVFQRGSTAWTLSLEEGAEAEELFEVRGGLGSLRWSPDGAHIAFVSRRGDHAFVGVFDVEARTIRYMDPSVDEDSNPVWSPDGTQVAFLREPNEGQTLPFIPRREGLPWSIRVADVATGQGRLVWQADAGPGSVYRGISADNQLLWGANDRLVFAWEGSGWTNLYSVPVAGGRATPLTPGDFEVQFVSLASDGAHVLYSSNQDDIDRQHVWRVPVAGGAAQRLTPADGIAWSPVWASDGSVLVLASDARTPAHAATVQGGGLRSLAPGTMPGDFPADHLVAPQQVVFPAADGMPIHGQLFLPPGHRADRQYPAVLFFHGGSRRQMLLGFHHRGYYHNAYAFNQYLASRGYVVLSVNYRSGIGYGMKFREALNYGARGASEFNDVLGAGLYLRGRGDVDPGRIGLWGGSYGGYLTALGLARASDLFAAGVDLHGVHDWNVVIRNFVPSYQAGAREEVARLAFTSSPMADIETWRSPVLLIHGDDDRNVPFSESVDLAEALRRQGVEFEQLIFPDEVHGFLLHRNWLAAYHAAAAFLDRHLKGSAAVTTR